MGSQLLSKNKPEGNDGRARAVVNPAEVVVHEAARNAGGPVPV
jgi:hypothetical protein